MPTIRSSLENYGQWQGEVWEQNVSGTLVPMFVKVNRIVSDRKEGDRYGINFIRSLEC